MEEMFNKSKKILRFGWKCSNERLTNRKQSANIDSVCLLIFTLFLFR